MCLSKTVRAYAGVCVCTCTWRPREGSRCLFCPSFLLEEGLSLNLRVTLWLGLEASLPSDPSLCCPQGWSFRHLLGCLACSLGARIRTPVLTILEEVLLNCWVNSLSPVSSSFRLKCVPLPSHCHFKSRKGRSAWTRDSDSLGPFVKWE